MPLHPPSRASANSRPAIKGTAVGGSETTAYSSYYWLVVEGCFPCGDSPVLSASSLYASSDDLLGNVSTWRRIRRSWLSATGERVPQEPFTEIG